MHSDEHLLQERLLFELQQINLLTLGSDKRIDDLKEFSYATLFGQRRNLDWYLGELLSRYFQKS